MKKLLLLALVLAGLRGTVGATDYTVFFNQNNNWNKLCDLTDEDGDGVYSAIVNFETAEKLGWGTCTIQLFKGTAIEDNWNNAIWANFDSDASILSYDAFTLNETYSKGGKLQIPIKDATPDTYAIKLEYTEESKTIKGTRLIEFASSNDDWHISNPVYMEETAHNTGIFTSKIALPANTEFKFVSNNNGAAGWYGNKDNSKISTDGSNIIVSADGVYTITANFNDTYVAPTLVTVPVTIGAVGYSTFSSEYAVDFSEVTDVTAYRAEQTSDNMVLLKKVTGKVAAATGLVLKGTTTTIPTTIGGTSYNLQTSETNYLMASVKKTTITPESGTSDYYYFLSGTSSVNAGFYKLENGNTYESAAGKAYYHTATPLSTTNSRASWIFEDETQGINNVESTQNADVIYDLQGRAAKTAKAGLYIKNGKKVAVK